MAKEDIKKTKLVFVQFWKTEKKEYAPNDTYLTNNEKIIDFLITNKIAEKWQQLAK